MLFADRLTLDAPRRTQDGYLAVRAKATRTGVYQYAGTEVDPDNKHGLRDQSSVNVLRDEAAVFDARSVHSFIGKPITNDHPREAVSASNWRDHARGVNMGAIRDGDHLAFDLVLMDASAIADVKAGKVELSNGYSCQLEFGDFTAADGTKCAARQTNITGNHVALVDRGRAGPTCRIGDAATCETIPLPQLNNDGARPVKKILLDGLTVDIADADTAEATIRKLEGERNEARDAKTAAETSLAAKDTEIATLKTEKKVLEDAKPTPAQLRDAAKSYAQVCDKAKALGVDVTDSMDEPAIMKAVVSKVMGDQAKDWNDAQIAASFAVATKDAKTAVQPLGSPVVARDAATAVSTARSAWLADKQGAYHATAN